MKFLIPKLKYLLCFLYLGVISVAFTNCDSTPQTLFVRLLDSETGIDFSNTIVESDSFNILTEEYIFNGGGVAIADFNKDGFQDVFFTGNQVPNKLYLNEGEMRFKDVSEQAKVNAGTKWHSGAVVVDINNDGWPDIYVCATMSGDSLRRANMLFLNIGTGDDQVPVFEEVASQYGIADMGHSTMAAFLDYDLDGDLDLYILTNQKLKDSPSNYRPKIVDGSSPNNDRLYRNNGNQTFTNVSKEAGIILEGFGLGVAVTDINLDGWPDIYVSNDFVSNDLLWINNQDGTFSNQVSSYFKHQSHSAMGNDVADINNDGLVDVIAVDMRPEDNKRKKMMIPANKYTTYINNEKYNYEYQYVRNTLQLNNGAGPDGHPIFSEIGQLSGIHQTDWSWTPLLADFDNDGYRDLLITNGFPRDITDHDFAVFSSGVGGSLVSQMALLDSIPMVKIPNYIYKNEKDLTFSDKRKDWGLEIPSYSNGAAYADLDNDGDLDLVINNINDKAFIYENQLYNEEGQNDKANNFLRVGLNGGKQKHPIEGVKIIVNYDGDKKSFYEQSVYRGYLSSVEHYAHFGLGETAIIDSILVIWPDRKQQKLLNVEANQVLEISYDEARLSPGYDINKEIYFTKNTPLFKDASKQYGIQHKHHETDKVDFNIQITLPHKFTQNGPGIAVADVNNDGLDDFFVGGSAGNKGIFYLQNSNGNFVENEGVGEEDLKNREDLGVLFFDADNDGDQDLYIVSGSYEFKPGSPELKDRFFLNDGQGNFTLSESALPDISSNGSVVTAADYDGDGDLDLFVGGNVIPGQYPFADRSFILKNENGRFVDVTEEVAPGLSNVGIVNDAKWSDFDNDGQVDLIIAGEWMPITIFKADGGNFSNVTKVSGLADYVGWWNSLASGDFDGDGDIDYLAGNLGLNTEFKGSKEHPLSVYASDFDGNGSVDPIITTWLKAEDGSLKEFPMHAKDDLTFLIPRMKKKFPKFAVYSKATIHEVLTTEEINTASILRANHLTSSYIENMGDGTFKISSLPLDAQFAPIFGMIAQDINEDGFLDIVAVGNSYSTEVSVGRYDALVGLYLLGNGRGAFETKGLESGFFVDGDAKGIATLGADGRQLWLVTQNNDSLKVFERKNNNTENSAKVTFRAEPMDAFAEIELADGKSYKHEFYYGTGYLSQSSRVLSIPGEMKNLFVTDFAGRKRKISLEDDMFAER